MQYYTKIVIDADGVVLESESVEYFGPVAEAKGGSTRGSGTTNTATTTTQVNPAVDRLIPYGEGFIRPALEGQQFAPVTGVRSMVEQNLLPLVPLMQKQLMGEGGQGGVFALPGQIQGHESLLPDARNYATRYAADIFDPTRATGMFTQSAERLLPQVRSGLAARGIAGGGVGQGIENQALSNLALDFALREDQARQSAIQQLTGVSGADLGERLQKTGGTLSAITGGQSAISRGFGLPMDVLNQAIQTELSPLQALIQLTGAASGGTNINTSNVSGAMSQKQSGPSGIFGK